MLYVLIPKVLMDSFFFKKKMQFAFLKYCRVVLKQKSRRLLSGGVSRTLMMDCFFC